VVTHLVNWGVSGASLNVRPLVVGMPLKRGEKIVQGPLSASSVEIRAIYYRNLRKLSLKAPA